MAQIQINLSEEENRIVNVYKTVNGLSTKQEAVKNMIRYFEVEIRPKNLKDKEFFK